MKNSRSTPIGVIAKVLWGGHYGVGVFGLVYNHESVKYLILANDDGTMISANYNSTTGRTDYKKFS